MSRLRSLLVLAMATVLLVPVNALTAKPRMPAMAAPTSTGGGTPAAGARELVAAGRESEAAALLADAIARNGASGCTFCYDALARTGDASEAEIRVVHSAFELVEQQARASSNGNPLVALAELCRRSGVESELGRGMWYLMEGFRLGNLSDESGLAALSLLDDLGWYAQAKSLAQSLHDDPESGLYQSPQTQHWIEMLDTHLSHAEFVTARLIAPKATVTYEGEDSIPLYRVPPTYPPQALKADREGEVVLGFTISETGHPKDVTVVSSSDRVFEKPAADSLSQWLYAPQLVAGVPVEKQDEQVMIRFVLVD